jgi:hypothetical protein
MRNNTGNFSLGRLDRGDAPGGGVARGSEAASERAPMAP